MRANGLHAAGNAYPAQRRLNAIRWRSASAVSLRLGARSVAISKSVRLNMTADQSMHEQVGGHAGHPADVGSRIDPVLARSWLLVNGAHDDRFESAAQSRADIVVLDIEDAVAPKDKDAARDNVVRWLGGDNADWVRINGFGTPWWADDIAALAGSSGRRGDAGDGRIGGSRHRDRETIAQRADRGAGGNGPGSGAHHRDRRDQRHFPARLRHRRFSP